MNEDPTNIIAGCCGETPEERREAIMSLEQTIEDTPELQKLKIELPVTHHFHAEIYMRELFIPRGTILTGRIHLFDHFELLISGDLTMSTESDEPQRITGYTVIKGMAGKKRAFYAHSDSIFMTVHTSDEHEPEEMYDRMTCDSFEQYSHARKLIDECEAKLREQIA